MATYNYKCEYIECEDYDKEVSVNKPMSEYNRVEECKHCKNPMQRVFSLGGHQTFGDGYKS